MLDKRLLLLFSLVLATGCDRLKERRTIEIVFSAAPAGISEGTPVFMAGGGPSIGTVRHVKIVGGVCRLAASVRPAALPARAVFLATDGVLIAYTLPPTPTATPPTDEYQGTDSALGLASILGDERAKQAISATRDWLLRRLSP
jgi:hypothetical protein